MQLSGQLHTPITLPLGKSPSLSSVNPSACLEAWVVISYCRGIEPRFLDRPIRSLVTIQFSYYNKIAYLL